MRTSATGVALLGLLALMSTGCCCQQSFLACHGGLDWEAHHPVEHFGPWDEGDSFACDRCGGAGCASCDDCGETGCDGCGHCGLHRNFPLFHWGCNPLAPISGCNSCLFGWGCGKVYLGDYLSHPPACCEPCDGAGHWIGPASSPASGEPSYGYEEQEEYDEYIEEPYSPHETIIEGETYESAARTKKSTVKKTASRPEKRPVKRSVHTRPVSQRRTTQSRSTQQHPVRKASRGSRPAGRRPIKARPSHRNRQAGDRTASFGQKL